ncbi:alpha/beta hydrolase [Microbacterium sp. STN6]|uniref:alpha/beta fold hydrolase n=1 Tax=Microbacterium sp. STN6 TaxID=2995588 RepID=UPI002260F56A|nr:alpha/beta hydrolase [Microbacterium sp. STN6]MCX7522468.1 alpha/beta hydrolase [Microbacterium sp. STN6]
MTTTRRVISTDGTSIAYETHGSGIDGTPVILIDGAMCFRGGGPMRALAHELARDMRVICYDRRGRGESGDTPPYEPVREVDDLAALIDAAGGRANLYALSSGVALALLAAAEFGHAIAGLALYEPPFSAGPDPTASDYTAKLAQLLAAGARSDALALFMRRVGVPEQGIEGMRHSPTWPQTEALAPTLAYDDALMGDGTLPADTVRRVMQPCLVMAGEASPPFLRDASENLAHALADAVYRTLPGQTHDAQPDVVACELRGFF